MSQSEFQVAATQGDIRAIKKEVEIVSAKVDDVHQALIGSELSKDGGMVKRLLYCESEVENIKNQINSIEKQHEKLAFYLKIIWGLGGVVLTAIVGFIFTHLIK